MKRWVVDTEKDFGNESYNEENIIRFNIITWKQQFFFSIFK